MSKITLQRNKLILVEGRDALNFIIWALEAYDLDDFHVLDFGGINDLDKYLKTLTLVDGFDRIESIVVIRDAESDHSQATSGVIRALKGCGLPSPNEPFGVEQGPPKVAFMLFPGFDVDGKILNGTLEDLCLSTINDNILQRADEYVEDINQNHQKVRHKHKAKLHAYLSAKNEYVGANGAQAKIFESAV